MEVAAIEWSDIIITALSVLFLIFFSAFFSGSETALTATSPARILHKVREGDGRAKRVQALTENREKLISSLLLGNNVVNILASALSTSLCLALFPQNGVVIATISMTLLVLIFAEVLPKTYALKQPERVSLFVARPLQICINFFSPFAWAITQFVSRVIHFISRNDDGEVMMQAHDELRGAIDLHHEQGGFVKQDKDMLGGVLDLKDLELSDIMVHRTNMVAIDIAEAPENIVKRVLDSPYTRMPIYEGDQENIIGVIHARDVLRELVKIRSEINELDIRALASEPWFVPDTTPVTDQLKEYLRRKAHIAFVVDEYGEVMGLVTLEDILEEIVGDIADEHDTDKIGIIKQADGSYIVEGDVPIRDLNRNCDFDLPDDEANTIAGLVIHEAKAIPNQGQSFNFLGFKFQVLRKQRNRLTSIRIHSID